MQRVAPLQSFFSCFLLFIQIYCIDRLFQRTNYYCWIASPKPLGMTPWLELLYVLGTYSLCYYWWAPCLKACLSPSAWLPRNQTWLPVALEVSEVWYCQRPEAVYPLLIVATSVWFPYFLPIGLGYTLLQIKFKPAPLSRIVFINLRSNLGIPIINCIL